MNKPDKLAVIFPGMGYHGDKPLLYYSKRLVRDHGYDVKEVRYDFPVRARDIMNDKDAKKEAFLHAVSEAKDQLADVDFANYKDVLFIGKSIGTAVAACYDKESNTGARHFVFTPVPETFSYLRKNSGIVIHGTADPWCDNELAEAKCEELELPLFNVEGANHSLETDDTMTDCIRMPAVLNRLSELM